MPFSLSCARLIADTVFIFVTTTIIITIDVEGSPVNPSGAVNFVPTPDIGPEETEVHVEIVNRKRVRRHLSTSSDPGIGTPDFEYHLKINSVSTPAAGMGAASASGSFSYDVKLQPVRRSVFGHGFKYTEVGRDNASKPYKHTYVPSREELDSLETKLYSDTYTKSVMRLEHDEDGDLNLYGVVHGAKIRTRRDAGTDGPKRTVMKIADLKPPSHRVDDVKDYVLLPVRGGLTRRTGASIDQKFDTAPELAIVFDYQMSKDIGGDKDAKLEYAAITVNGVNGYYELTNDELSIKCELVSVYVIESEADQPFFGQSSATNMVDKNGKVLYIAYDSTTLLHTFSRWVFNKAADLGKYDIAALDGSLKFQGNTAGVAGTPGACRFSDGGGESMATLIGSDVGANFEGIIVLAHEIGHSMGSPHDGKESKMSGDYKLPDTTACPFDTGNLMGYKRDDVYTNAFRFSKCSLSAIKTYLMTDMAKCLMSDDKTGRRAPYTTQRQAGDGGGIVSPYDPAKHCKELVRLKYAGAATSVSYQIPDEQCRLVWCDIGDERESNSGVPPRNTPCGDNPQKGKCRNGFCVGQGPALDLNAVCQMRTRDKEVKASGGDQSEVCSGTLHCEKEMVVEGSKGIATSTLSKLVLVPGTPCGDQKICVDKKCVSRDQVPNGKCVEQTGKNEAKQQVLETSNSKCTGLILCTYGSEFELLGEARADPDCNREAAKIAGKTFHVDIPTKNPNPGHDGAGPPIGGQDGSGQPSSPSGHTLEEVCSTEFGAGSTVAVPKGGDRNNLCSNLVCIDASGDKKDYEKDTPDGAICGPLRRCKSGQCVNCGKQG